MSDFEKKVVETIRTHKCTRPGCKSSNQDQLEVAWYGTKFDCKEFTCSSCVLRNDEVLNRLEPVALNMMPVSGFIKKGFEEFAEYQKLKASKQWPPKLNELRKKQVLSNLDTFQKRLLQTLKQLIQVLQSFGKRVAQRSNQIFTVGQFEQILKMENDNNFSRLLQQIEILLKKIHKVGENSYKFVLESERNARNSKLKMTIAELSKKTATVLNNLCAQIKEKTEEIGKI